MNKNEYLAEVELKIFLLAVFQRKSVKKFKILKMMKMNNLSIVHFHSKYVSHD